MGNGVLRWLCVVPARTRRRRRAASLVLWGGETRAAEPGSTAGEVMVEHGAGGRVVCRADGFRIGRRAPVLAVEDRLEAGCTYLVVPMDRLPTQGQGAVTAASLAALSYDNHNGRGGGVQSSAPSLAGGGRSPFEYVKDSDGRTVISVTEEFIVKAVTGRRPPAGAGGGRGDEEENGSPICSTPELRKHYELLVGAARGRPWSPRLETIEERKARRGLDVVISPRRLSPARLLGLVKGSSELARMSPSLDARHVAPQTAADVQDDLLEEVGTNSREAGRLMPSDAGRPLPSDAEGAHPEKGLILNAMSPESTQFFSHSATGQQ